MSGIIRIALFIVSFSCRNVVANQIMAKYGWKEGQGLGREEQGLSTCLQVEKTGKRAGKIINRDVEKEKAKFNPLPPPPLPPSHQATPPRVEESAEADDTSITDMMKNPSKVVLLKVIIMIIILGFYLNN